MSLLHPVIPAQAGIHLKTKGLDSRLRGNDGSDKPTLRGYLA
jgi:hypothetical protein